MKKSIIVLTGDISEVNSGPNVSLNNILKILSEEKYLYILGFSHFKHNGNWFSKNCKFVAFKNFLPSHYYFNPFLLIYFLKNIRKSEFVIINGVWYPYLIFINIFIKIFKKKYSIIPHGQLNQLAFQKNHLLKKLMYGIFIKSFIKNSKFLHLLSPLEKIMITQNKYIKDLKFNHVIVPNTLGIDSNVNTYNSFSYPKPYALFIGRIDPIKNLEFLIKAWSDFLILQSNNLDKEVELLIAGNGSDKYKINLEELIRKLNIKNIKFIGFVEGIKKIKLISNASCTVMCSHSEALPTSIIESFFYGTPIISTFDIGFKSIEINKTVFLSSQDTNQFAEKLFKVFKLKKSELSELRNVSFSVYKKIFSYYAVAKILKDAYK